MFGYMGKLLWIDLCSKTTEERMLSEDECRLYLGGSGLAAKWLFDLTKADTDPLSPENPLIISTGPLTGTAVPLSGRHAVTSLSPLTGIFGECDVGGHFGNMLKKAGFDALIITGASDKPVYLWVCDGKVEIRDAEKFWGMDTYEADLAIKAETDLKCVTGLIGQAGENLGLVSCIIFDGNDARAAGRCGLGTVMGSKHLKGIAAFGTQKMQVAMENELRESLTGRAKEIHEKTAGLHDFGTAGSVIPAEKRGDMPVHNWLDGSWAEGAEHVSGQTLAQNGLIKTSACHMCPIGCGRVVKRDSGRYQPVEGAGPEYETLGMFGGCCNVDDLDAILVANEKCNRYGMDTISVGGAIAMAMEAYEKGYITAEMTGNVELKWGDAGSLLYLIDSMGRAEGIGKLLLKGVRQMAKTLGPDTEVMAIHTKGLEFPAHDPRGHYSQALGYATSNRGACHVQSFSHNLDIGWKLPDIGLGEIRDPFDTDRKPELVFKMQNLMSVYDSVKMCKFAIGAGITVTEQANWVRCVTGWSDFSLDELMLAGERIFNLKRMLNVRRGIRRKDDTLPDRILHHKRGSGHAAEALPPLDEMLPEYYALRGWDSDGVPQKETLRRLGLDWMLGKCP